MASLLAVDLGLRSGLALLGDDGKLRWYRSHNFGKLSRIRRGVFSMLNEIDDLEWMVLEGGDQFAGPWKKEGERRGVGIYQISAETWRPRILHPRQQRSGAKAKQNADLVARQFIAWSGAPRPTSLRHDAAEAILIGMWGVLELEWLTEIPVR